MPPKFDELYQEAGNKIKELPEDGFAAAPEPIQQKQHAKMTELAMKRGMSELYKKNKELQERLDELEAFSFAASHDLQEPLRKVRMFGNLILNSCAERLNEKEHDYFARMLEATGRMQEMIQELLSYSRVSSQVIPMDAVDLNESLRNALSNLQSIIEKSGARIAVRDLPTVKGDPIQIESLFQNLISNAIKYQAPNAVPEIIIHAFPYEIRNGEKIETWTEIQVVDNGIGFDLKYADRIFTPFERLHGRSQYEGNGLGLAICKKIVERHRGKISVVSAPGKGSTFIVRLPSFDVQIPIPFGRSTNVDGSVKSPISAFRL